MEPRALGERFDVGARLGAGSFGVVYEAFDRYRNRTVALKVLERVAADTVVRFKREFRYLAEIRHPNLASMYELVVAGGEWILVMELIRGAELLTHLAALELQESFLTRIPTQVDLDGDTTLALGPHKTSLNALSAIYIEHVREAFRQLAVAIAVLHRHGIIHRDIKPSNIMITGDGRVVLLDFGLVIPQSYDDSLDGKAVVGTPGFMSPEQVMASAITPASDWYGFGAMLFQALVGNMPFGGATAMAIIERQMHEDPPRPAEVVEGVPLDLSELAFDCLQRDPAARPDDETMLRRVGMADFDPQRVERARDRGEVLIGRARELRTLRRHVESAIPGVPRLILVHGSPGAGKSALTDTLLDSIRSSGDTLILGGRCQPWESVPLNAIDAIVDSLTRELRRDRSSAVEEIMRTALAVTQLFPVLAAAAPSDIGDERVSVPASGERLIARAASELRAILLAAARGRPIVMLLDDAQYGDYQSVQMFRRLLEGGQNDVSVLIVCYRSEDWRTSLLLQGLTATNMERRELHLHELSRAMTQKLVKRKTGRGGRHLAGRVFLESGGNAMLTEMISQVLDSAPDDGLLAYAVNARLERLSAAARLMLAYLLSAGDAVPDEEVFDSLELFEVDEPLRTLSHERLIRMRRTGDLREIDVYHPRMRDVLVGPVKQTMLRRRLLR